MLQWQAGLMGAEVVDRGRWGEEREGCILWYDEVFVYLGGFCAKAGTILSGWRACSPSQL
jgi:hypothetical protein